MSLRVYKPAAMVELKIGEEGTPPKSFDFALVMQRDLATDELEPHPAFVDQHGRARQMREFDIELISNLVDYNCGSHLECREYSKKTIFCSRNHRGKDGLGIAHRLGEDGEFFQTVCDPGRCDLRINQVNNNTKIRRIHEKWTKLYPNATLTGMNYKRELEAVKCKHSMYFIFRLLTPAGEYAHATGEFCMFSSHGETNHRIYRKLCDLYDATAGNLAGLRLKLVYDPVNTTYGGKPKAAWNIFQPEGTDLAEMRRAALERTVVQQTALARIGDSTALAKAIEENPDIVAMALSEKRRQEQITAEMGDPVEAGLLYFNPMVREICERLDLTNMWISTLPMIAKGNMSRFVYWAREQAKNYSFTPYGQDKPVSDPRSIEDILQKYGWGDWQATPAPALPAEASAAQEEEGTAQVSATPVYQPEDAEFAEVVEEEPFDPSAALNAAKGIVDDGASSSGKTADFGSANEGSTPSAPASTINQQYPELQRNGQGDIFGNLDSLDPLTKLPGEEGYTG